MKKPPNGAHPGNEDCLGDDASVAPANCQWASTAQAPHRFWLEGSFPLSASDRETMLFSISGERETTKE
jgi:hypothetical protein